MSVRIIGLDEVSTIQDGNYIAIDSETGGTKKFDATKVGYLMGQNIAADYNSSAQYVVGEFCMYDGKLYKCTTNITTPEAWNAGHWTQVTVGTSLYDKVDKVSGKGLSANDFTDALKDKLDNIASGAQVNVIDGVKVDGVALTPDGNKDVDIVGKANQSSIANAYSTTTNYVRGDYVMYQNTLYKCLQATTGTWDATKWEQAVVGDDLEQKANIDGLYEGMTVGGAEQLLSNVYEEDQVPYNFRTSGGSIDIGDREYDKIVGCSLVWNQLQVQPTVISNLYENNVLASVTDGVVSFTANAQNGSVSLYPIRVQNPQNHRCLVCAYIKTSSITNVPMDVNYHSYYPNVANVFAPVYAITNGNPLAISFKDKRSSGWDEVQCKNFQVFDLTAMFGSTIADYIYSLEQATAGAGVAWFKKLFPKPYYEYDVGGIESVKAGSHEMVGFNQWDEEWEVGDIDNLTGVNVVSSSCIRSKNYIPVISNTTYYFKSPKNVYIYFYDSNKNYVRYTELGVNNTFNIRDGESYIRFRVNTTYGTTYNHDICINLSWDGERNGEYEPYVKHSYPLDDTLELRGIPKLDASNQLYYDGDTYESDGTVTRRYGIVDLGTLNWGYSSSVFYANISGAKKAGETVVQKYTNKGVMEWNTMVASSEDKIFANCSVSAESHYAMVKDSTYADAATFKAAMSGVYLVYELAEPTTEQAQPYTNPQIVDDWGTEEYTDYAYEAGDRDVAIPVGHDTKYTANLRAKIEMAPDSPSGNGDYIMRQTDGTNSYVPLVIPNELPSAPTTDGTYRLQVVVASGTPTLSWVSAM